MLTNRHILRDRTLRSSHKSENCSLSTFPQGESQEGSPGLEAFHRTKSVGFLFSSCLSADTVSSPKHIEQKQQYSDYNEIVTQIYEWLKLLGLLNRVTSSNWLLFSDWDFS